MIYRRLGKTEIMVPVIGFGGIKLGNLSQEEVTALVKGAYENGMNYIDTARCYGRSEMLIGNAMAELGLRDKFTISSKIISRDLEPFKADVETTFNNLKTDYIEILFLHDVSTAENWNKISTNGILDYMQELKAQGRIGHIAVSTHDLKIGEKMLKTGLFEVTMLAYNPSSTEPEEKLLPLCHEMDIGVVIMKPLGGGVLTEKRSAQLGFSISAKECLRFAASNSLVSTVIPGIDKPEYLQQAIEVAEGSLELTAEERQVIIDKIDPRSNEYCRGCGYCLPCVKGIPIPTVLALYNRWQVFGGIDYSQMHQISKAFEDTVPADKGPENCISCGKCVERCPFNLPIPQLMSKAAKMPHKP